MSFGAYTQNRPVAKFGKVSVEEFKPSPTVIDSTSAAIILFDIASSDFEGNNNGDFTLVFKHHKRVLIKKRSAFDEATVAISLYSGGSTASTERLFDIQASTFTMSNGAILEVKLKSDDILTEKVNSEQTLKKFTFPSLKEDCIIDYEYTIKSPYYSRLKSWVFQGDYPVLWSEYTVTIPPLFDFLTNAFGYLPYTVSTATKKFRTYTIRTPAANAYESPDFISLSGDAVTSTWAIKDIPSFKAENYTSTPRNHISRIQFQLRAIKYSDNNIQVVVKDWYKTADDLMKDIDFSKQIYEENDWLKSEIKQLTTDGDDLTKARKIFAFVRDNYTCNDHSMKWLSQPLKKTFQSKTGNVADINMLLSAMLKKAGFYAVPVLLSTSDNGRVNETVALLTQYNYVISKVDIGDKTYLLDASRARLGFGDLPADCYNGSGRIIDVTPSLVPLDPDSVSDIGVSNVILEKNKDNKLTGSYFETPGKFASVALRNKLAAKKDNDIVKEITKGYPQGFTFSNVSVDSLKFPDLPLLIKYDIELNLGDGDEELIYFNPMLQKGYQNNPFVSAERLYPVEMPYCINETFLLTMDIPEGYRVEELPKSMRVKFNVDEGGFEYIVTKQENKVMLKSQLFFKKAIFTPDDYQALRDFFGFVVKKHAEQIVFKKN